MYYSSDLHEGLPLVCFFITQTSIFPETAPASSCTIKSHITHHILAHSDLSSVTDPDPNLGPGPSEPYASWIRIHKSEVWIRIRLRILLSPSKNTKNNLDYYCFLTSV